MEAQQQNHRQQQRPRSRSISHLVRFLRHNRPTVLTILLTSTRGVAGEAALTDEHGIFPLCKALARPVDDYIPVSTIRRLIDAYPKAIWFKTKEGRTPLAAAGWRRAPLDVLQLLVQARPAIPEDYVALQALWKSYLHVFGNQDELVDLICENGGSREGSVIWTKFHLLLRYCTSDQMVQPWRGLRTAASASVCDLELFRILLVKHPEQVKCVDEHGCLPLHHLVALCPILPTTTTTNDNDPSSNIQAQDILCNRQARLRLLLEAYPEAAQVKDALGRLPLHVAIESGWEDLEGLMEAYPDSLLDPDGVFRLFPFQLAAWSPNASLSTTYTLLHQMPQVLDVARQMEDWDAGFDLNESPSSTDSFVSCSHDNDESYASSDNFESLLEELASKEDATLWPKLNQLLRSSSSQQQQQSADDSSWRVVHAASLSAKCPAGLLQIALRLYPEQARQPNEQGLLPLHMVCTSGAGGADDCHSDPESDDIDYQHVIQTKLELLLQAFPEAAHVRNRNGQLPLHLAAIAAGGGLGPASLDRLIAAWPEALCQRDRQRGLFPFLLAASNPAGDVTSIFQLLVADPHVIQFCDL